MKTSARAHSNIALIKYWGKRDSRLNLPAVGSISITLDELFTETSVEFNSGLSSDVLFLNNQQAGQKETKRIAAFLNMIREKSQQNIFASVESSNNFPTAAGLASSASAFAALALAASKAAGLELTPQELSILARRGSGSAARSLFGGFVEMSRGENSDGSDSFARQLYPAEYWDLRVVIAVTSEEKKQTGSTDGMTLSKETSPYYSAWVNSSPDDLSAMRDALRGKDFQKLGELSEFSSLKMHALAMASNPGLLYWNESTLQAVRTVREMRAKGNAVYFTIDAGPQVKAICLPENEDEVAAGLGAIPGVRRILKTRLGACAQLLEEQG